MATDVSVQFFSHFNGITLGNNWGDLIRLLDTCLVNGLPFASVTSASIDANGDINLTFFAAHNAVLFQIVELTGFSPSNINGKYRIKGLPTSTQMILKAELSGQSVAASGSAKLAALGYDIIFRDANDVKRVYRSKNPTSAHPFIRVDETISDGTNSYTSTYAKYAMVGLLENMTHIDDYENADVLQLPLSTSNLKLNYSISGSGSTVVRGWSRWTWARINNLNQSYSDASTPSNGNRNFTLVGDNDAFYMVMPFSTTATMKRIYGAGLFNSCLKSDVIPAWFLMSRLSTSNASTNYLATENFSAPLVAGNGPAQFIVPRFTELNRVSNHVTANPVLPDYSSGFSGIYSANSTAALEIPFSDSLNYLRGTLKHVAYNGNSASPSSTTASLQDKSMYIYDSVYAGGASNAGSLLFYLGELE
ncbi:MULTISPECIES: hypothetical protein [Acinetobacter]|uniref:hypothetical protein n=1 Tax=Acinetobacter TaxID=469 RepID=UPI001CE4B3A4|nr:MULTISPECIES: hypothetical protein [Acinetobacter]MCI3877696.1 hypothetical protein [Acinetobacter higginsii]